MAEPVFRIRKQKPGALIVKPFPSLPNDGWEGREPPLYLCLPFETGLCFPEGVDAVEGQLDKCPPP